MKTVCPNRILVVTLLFIQSSCILWAQQSGGNAARESQAVVQRLSQLLAPFQVEVSGTALASSSQIAGTRELHIQWSTAAAGPNPSVPRPGLPPAGLFAVSTQRRYAEPPLRQRSLELTSGRMLVAAIDKNNRLISWSIIPDPRLVRSEGPGPDGVLRGETLYFEKAEFLLSLPDDPEIVEIRFYQPRPEGATIDAIGQMTVSR